MKSEMIFCRKMISEVFCWVIVPYGKGWKYNLYCVGGCILNEAKTRLLVDKAACPSRPIHNTVVVLDFSFSFYTVFSSTIFLYCFHFFSFFYARQLCFRFGFSNFYIIIITETVCRSLFNLYLTIIKHYLSIQKLWQLIHIY